MSNLAISHDTQLHLINFAIVTFGWFFPYIMPSEWQDQVCLTADALAILVIWIIPCSFALFHEFVRHSTWCQRYKIQLRDHTTDEENLYRLASRKFLGDRLVFTLIYGMTRPNQQTIMCGIPDPLEMVQQLIITILTADFVFYLLHRFVLHQWVYQFHKQHHEFTKPHIFSTMWAGVLESISVLPIVIIPILWWPMHVYTALLWITIGISHTYYVHSGFDLPIRPLLVPFASGSRVHDAHHQFVNCNYGLYYHFWDWLFGTFREEILSRSAPQTHASTPARLALASNSAMADDLKLKLVLFEIINFTLKLLMWLTPGLDRTWATSKLSVDVLVVWINAVLPCLNALFYETVARIPSLDRYKIQTRPLNERELQNEQKVLGRLVYGRIGSTVLWLLFRPDALGQYTSTAVPTQWETIYHLALAFIGADFYYYLSHRLAHSVAVMYRFHKQHHEFVRCSYRAIMWTHVVEMGLLVGPVVVFPVYILQMHTFTFALFISMVINHGYYKHCNYEFPVSVLQWIPFADTVRMHDAHHQLVNGNFGIYFPWFDDLFGTRIYVTNSKNLKI